MSKIPIEVDGKTYYMDVDAWEKEQEWRRQRERELPKFFRKVLGEWN